MRQFKLIGVVLFLGTIIGTIYDYSEGATYSPSGILLTRTIYGTIFGYLLFAFFGIYFGIFIRFIFKYPQLLFWKTFSNGIEEVKPLGRIIEYPGRTAKQLTLQNSPYSESYKLDLGESNAKFDYWDCEIKFRFRGMTYPMIVGNIEVRKESRKVGKREVIDVTRIFTPILLAKNYENFLYDKTQNILSKLNVKMVEQSNKDLEQLEQNAGMIFAQRKQLEEIEDRILRLSKDVVTRPYSTVLALFCRLTETDPKEINVEEFDKIVSSLKGSKEMGLKETIKEQIMEFLTAKMPNSTSPPSPSEQRVNVNDAKK